ncbi:hypothetical protein ACPEEZ_08050 [Frigoribacterium sp. 2-23]|uniref:hypothetical protein n=1 Tax=Frigoribacterium sp. 2-23 TaxID=3415006 RepID=UPI003C6EE60C
MRETHRHVLPGAPGRAVACALAVARHRHVAVLIDVRDDPSDRADDWPTPIELELDGPAGTPLPRWLALRGSIDVGEAVTVLLPLLGALQHLSHRGIDATGTGLDDVVIDEEGAPVISSPRPGGRPAEGAARDLVETVLAFVDHEVALTGREGASFDDLVEFVSDLATPLPLETAPTGSFEDETDELERARPTMAATSETPTWLAMMPESAVLERVSVIIREASWAGTVEAVRRVRPRYWALGGIMSASLVAALAIVGPSVETASTGDGSAHGIGPEVVTSPGDGHDTVAGSSSDSAKATSATDVSATESSSSDDSVTTQAILGDDPVPAADALLVARRGCLREPTESCFADTDQLGSPLSRADAAYTADPGTSARQVDVVSLRSVMHRLGDTVLLSATGADDEPASVLVVRTEAGWRLREISATRG